MNGLLLTVAVVLGVLLLCAWLVWVVLNRLLFICGPNEVLIFSGRRDGRDPGSRYVAIAGGRAVRVPLIEVVDRVDLTNMIIDVSVQNAYSKGGIPLNVQGVANVKIASHEPVLSNAVTRFLDYDRKEVVQVVKDTLEGNLRGVLSQLTPEQVNDDKLAFAEKLLEEAEHDLSRLGLVLDTLKIQNVSDDKGYLTSIGRKSSADLIRRSRVAEANAQSSARVNEALNRERARVRDIEMQMEIVRAETERRVADTLTRREALIAEEQGGVLAAIARAEGELEVYQARVEQVKRQLEADVVAPARAEMEAQIAEAQGAASRIVEDGKATARVLDQTIEAWKLGGPGARDIFLLQKLQVTLGQLTSTIQNVRVDRVTVLPPDAAGAARPAVTLVEELKGALGVDVPALVRSYAQRPE